MKGGIPGNWLDRSDEGGDVSEEELAEDGQPVLGLSEERRDISEHGRTKGEGGETCTIGSHVVKEGLKKHGVDSHDDNDDDTKKKRSADSAEQHDDGKSRMKIKKDQHNEAKRSGQALAAAAAAA